jgi:hypothetical protein
MSKLYCKVVGDRDKPVTKAGHRVLEAHVSGWDFGVRVEAEVTASGSIKFRVVETGGSNSPKETKLVHTVEA